MANDSAKNTRMECLESMDEEGDSQIEMSQNNSIFADQYLEGN